MGSHYFLQQRPFASFYPTIFFSRLPALFLFCSYWSWQWEANSPSFKLLILFALLWLLLHSARSMVKTLTLSLAPSECEWCSSPPCPFFGPAHPSHHFQSPAAFKVSFPYWEMHILKTKLLKRNSVETSSSFPRSSSSSGIPWVYMNGGAPYSNSGVVCFFQAPGLQGKP